MDKLSTVTLAVVSKSSSTVKIDVRSNLTAGQSFRIHFITGTGIVANQIFCETIPLGEVRGGSGVSPSPLRVANSGMLFQPGITYAVTFSARGGDRVKVRSSITTLTAGCAEFVAPFINSATSTSFVMNLRTNASPCGPPQVPSPNLFQLLEGVFVDKDVDTFFENRGDLRIPVDTLGNTNDVLSVAIVCGQGLNLRPANTVTWQNKLIFDGHTEQDSLAKTYRRIAASSAALYECLSCQVKTLSNDPTLGTITLHEVIPPAIQVVINVADPSVGALSTTASSTGLRLTETAPTVSSNLIPISSFACNSPVVIHRTLSFPLNSTSATFSINRSVVQVYRFSNRSGEAYVANGDCAESTLQVGADENNQILETCEKDNNKSYTQ